MIVLMMHGATREAKIQNDKNCKRRNSKIQVIFAVKYQILKNCFVLLWKACSKCIELITRNGEIPVSRLRSSFISLLTYLRLSSNSPRMFLINTLSSFTSQMLLCSSVRILSRNLPSQLGTLVWGITMYSPGGRVKNVTTSLATEWLVTSRGFWEYKQSVQSNSH